MKVTRQEIKAAVVAIDDFLSDMTKRAKMNGDVDDDGTAILECGAGVLYRLKQARDALARQA